MSLPQDKGKDADIQLKVKRLADMGKIDTVYRDLYILRARTILSEMLPQKDYRNLMKEQSSLAGMAAASKQLAS